MNLDCFIRCDFSPKIGYGHIVRCLALAEIISSKYEYEVSFAFKDKNVDLKIIPDKFNVIEKCNYSYQYNEEKWLNFLVKKYKPKFIIFDIRTSLSQDSLKEIKKNNIKIICIDDPSERRLISDLNFYPPSPKISQMNWNEFKGINYIGWEYYILRKEFFNNYQNSHKTKKSILISMGGSDPNNFTLETLKILNSNTYLNYKLEIIIGPGYCDLNELENYLKLLNHKYRIHKSPNVEEFIKIVKNCFFAIVTFGVTAYEIVALELPSIHICSDMDQLDSSSIFEKEGVAISIYKDNLNSLNEIINDFINKVSVIKLMSEKSSLLSKKFKQTKLVDELFKFLKK